MKDLQRFALGNAFARASDLRPGNFRTTPDGVSIGLSVNK